MKVQEVLGIRRYKAGYEVREEVIDDSEYGGDGFVTKTAYTPDGHYIGDSKQGYRLCNKRGIAPELAFPNNNVCCIGFCEKEQKWYGWSHRAIYGFGIGDEVKKGSCAYTPSSVDELYRELTTPCPEQIEDAKSDPTCTPKMPDVEKIEGGVRIKNEMVRHAAPNAETGELTGWVDAEPDYEIIKTGRGEWTANTLNDARQMAIDFADGVG